MVPPSEGGHRTDRQVGPRQRGDASVVDTRTPLPFWQRGFPVPSYALEGTTLGDSRSAVLLFETTVPTRFYLPEADLAPDVLTTQRHPQPLPVQGRRRPLLERPRPARPARHRVVLRPSPAVGAIAGRVAFYDELLDITVDGVRLDRPNSPFSTREQRPGAD